MPLGRFLEISVATRDIVESLSFYESLGLVQASVGEAWPHPYAVVTDGRLSVGLHAQEFDSPMLTWVAPSLRERLDALAGLGIEIEAAQVDEASLNFAVLRSPSGQGLRLLEARTYSPPALAPGHATLLGYFEEYALPSSDMDEARTFWEHLGFVAFDPVDEPFSRVVASSRDLNLGFYGLDLATPALVFSASDMAQRIEQLRDRGHRFARRLPRELQAIGAALLEAPEGTTLLLLDEAVLAD